MTERVVDELEGVEVEAQDGDESAVPPNSGERNPETLAEQGPIGQVGQAVVVGHMGDLRLDGSPVRDILGDAETVLPGAGLIVDLQLPDAQKPAAVQPRGKTPLVGALLLRGGVRVRPRS